MKIYAIVKKLCPLSCLAIKKFHSDVFTTSDTNKDSVNRQLKKIGYMYIQDVPKNNNNYSNYGHHHGKPINANA